MRSRVRAVTPLLVVSDLQRSIDFYVRALGFVEPNVHGDPPCFALMNRDGFDLMLSLGEDPADVRPHGPSGTWDFYVSVADIAAEIAALAAHDVRLDKGPTDTFYGMREIEVVDPDGHRVCLAQDVSGEPLATADRWEGVLDVGSAKLRLVLHLAPSQGRFVGRLDSPDQGASNLAVDGVTLEGGRLRFEMRAIGARYDGQASADGAEFAGRWSQGGREWPLVFLRA
jgi:catechol 2,3-dioxygenase-like lactoylglutathione lyase family enzyme